MAQIGYISRDIQGIINRIQSYNLFELSLNSDLSESDHESLPFALKTARQRARRASGNDHHVQTKGFESIQIDIPSTSSKKSSEVLPCREYIEQLDHSRNEKTCELVKEYDSIGPTLIKLESLILGTVTGESEKMIQYYTFWEKEAFSCLTKFVVKNLEDFAIALKGDKVIFQVDADLSAPEIILRPIASEIYNIIIHSVKDFIDRY